MERQIPWTKPNRSAKPSPQSARVQQLNGMATLLRAAKYSRLILAGGPRAGKSHLAEALRDDGIRLYGSDALIGLGWSESSAKASEWFDGDGPWIAEGVAMPRALRKWIARSPGRPADCVVWLG